MALFRRLFYRKPPDRLLEISERVYVFDCCFSTDVLDEDEYKVYLSGIVAQLQDYFPDASFMVFNFREGERRSQISDILSQYDMTVMDYPRQYEGCPLLPLEMVHHFLRSSESWLSLEGQQNVLLMHCERGGWPVLAFMLAGLLLYRKQYTGEQKTLEMVYKQAPKELLHLLSSLNPQPSQMRYLQYISRRNMGTEWPPSDTPLFLDCIILRVLPLFEGGKGCRPVVRVYGQDPSTVASRSSKLLFSTSKQKKRLSHYRQAECAFVKIDVHCHVQGDVVIECIHLDEDLVREEMIFRVMFHTAFVRSNILMLSRDEIDVLWDARDQFSKDFKAEVLFLDADAVGPNLTTEIASEDGNETESPSPEEFFEVEEIFSNVIDGQDGKVDCETHNIVQHKTLDDGYPKEVSKEDFDSHAFQDCPSDDGNHKVNENDTNGSNKEVEFVVVDADALSDTETKEVTEELCVKPEEMGKERDREDPVTEKQFESKVTDVSRQKSGKLLPPITKKQPNSTAKEVASDATKANIKQQEPQVTLSKPTKQKIVSRWIPPNKGPYTNSMHISYPPSRYNSAPAVLSDFALKVASKASSNLNSLPYPAEPEVGLLNAISELTEYTPETVACSKETVVVDKVVPPVPPPPPPPPPPLPSSSRSSLAPSSYMLVETKQLSTSPPPDRKSVV